MEIQKLQLKNFRSYTQKEVEFTPGINVIYGKNAQGKTNLLEALFFCAVTRSFRGAADKELMKFGTKGYEIGLSFDSQQRPQEILIRCSRGKKEFFINGVKKQRRGDFVGTLKCVLFAPEHMALIKNGPGERRRFIDMSLCQWKPAYYTALNNYQKLLEQKNVLLKKAEGGNSCDALLELYNEKLAFYCAQVMRERKRYLDDLEGYAQKVHLELSQGSEILTLHYEPSPRLDPTMEGLEEAIRSEMDRHLEREKIMKSSLVGCHRDNFEISLNGYSARTYGSQGQQRSCVLSLKMAECDIFKEAYGEYPVLLLDDILSELDERRKAYVVGHISGRQVIITCCEKEIFQTIENTHVIEVVKEEEPHPAAQEKG